MPYKTIKDLPDTAKVLPIDGQRMWLRVFNENSKKNKSEEDCIKLAWGVVKRFYRKDPNGKWRKIYKGQ